MLQLAKILNTNLEKYSKKKLDAFEQEKLAELKINLQAVLPHAPK